MSLYITWIQLLDKQYKPIHALRQSHLLVVYALGIACVGGGVNGRDQVLLAHLVLLDAGGGELVVFGLGFHRSEVPEVVRLFFWCLR